MATCMVGGVQAKHSAEVADLVSLLDVKESELAAAIEQIFTSQAAAKRAEQAGFFSSLSVGPHVSHGCPDASMGGSE